jgi:hypothetical protein
MQDVLPPSAKRHKTDLTDNFSKKLLFFEILDLLINQIEIRFKDISSLNFLELTDSNKFDVFSRNASVERSFSALKQ